MNIICHRGLWKSVKEQNTLGAFREAFDRGFGIETDLRDHQGEICIAHDITSSDSYLTFAEVLDLAQAYSPCPPLALNIKADGLASEVERLVDRYEVGSYRCFDMSVPDQILYMRRSIEMLTRVSDLERVPVLLERSRGVWLDAFESEAHIEEDAAFYLGKGYEVWLVSSELHGRQNEQIWDVLQKRKDFNTPNLFVCTDRPIELSKLFQS